MDLKITASFSREQILQLNTTLHSPGLFIPTEQQPHNLQFLSLILFYAPNFIFAPRWQISGNLLEPTRS